MYIKVYETPLRGNSLNNHRDFSNYIRDVERKALLRRGGWVAEWISYHLLDLLVAGSNTGGEICPTLIALNYSFINTEAN